MTETKPKRRWFRFSTRDLLWLTVVVGLVTGWWFDRKRAVESGEQITANQTSLIVSREIDFLKEENKDLTEAMLAIARSSPDHSPQLQNKVLVVRQRSIARIRDLEKQLEAILKAAQVVPTPDVYVLPD
jgi:hypothetical protein